MALLQIAEPGQSSAPHEHRIAIGIDLGTTHSLVATVLSGKPKVLNDEKERRLLPSIVHYGNDVTHYGEEAKPFIIADPKYNCFCKAFYGTLKSRYQISTPI